MEYLPAEIQLKILKNLNFDELIKIKQTSHHFCNFINKYKNELAHKRFDELYFRTSDLKFEVYDKINLSFNSDFVRDMANNFPLSNQLQEKWQSAVDKQIPVCIINSESTISNKSGTFLIFMPKIMLRRRLSLKLPLFAQNIEELKIIRYWLLEIFSCVFNIINCDEYIFNPEMIKLLFDNEEINKLKFNCQRACISLHLNIDATLDRLVINEFLIIDEIITEKKNDILFKLLLNEGYRIPAVFLFPLNNQIVFCNNFINYIETSTDLSKMVAKIKFYCENLTHSKLIVKGVETKESNDRKKSIKLKISMYLKWNFQLNGKRKEAVYLNIFKLLKSSGVIILTKIFTN